MTPLPAAVEAVRLLRERGETIACAESLTGGLLCAALVDVPGASDVVVGGVVSYATRVKHSVLGVVAIGKFGIMLVGMTKKGNAPPAQCKQMLARQTARTDIVRPDRRADIIVADRTPAYEMRAMADKLLQPLLVERIIPIAEQDEAIGAVAVLIADMPVILHFLERDEQVKPAGGALAGDGPQHGKEEGIDVGFVRRRVLEKQQCDRIRPLRSQR